MQVRNFDFFVPKKALKAKIKTILVVGKVGSGKSSLISGILGEMYKLNNGKISVNGSMAYVPQQAWILNASVQDNILFGKDFDESF